MTDTTPPRSRSAATAVARGLDWRPALRVSVTPFLVGKVLTLLVVYLAAWQHGGGTGVPGWGDVRDVFANWDGKSYLQIAHSGYPPNVDTSVGAPAHVWAFFPGYPMLVNALSFVLRDQILSGIVLSAFFELVALVFVVRLVSAERDERAARIAVWLLALVPYGVFLSLVYTESTFLAFAAANLYYLRQRRWYAAGVCGFLATSVRITGLALLPAYVWELRAAGRSWGLRENLAGVLIAAPFGLFCLYAYLHAGDAYAFFHIESSASFHRGLTNPWDGFRATFDSATGSSQQSATYIFMLELISGLAGLVACVLMWTWKWVGARWNGGRGIPLPFAVYASLVWLLAVAQPYWLSVGRYDIALLPLLVILTDLLRRDAQRTVAVIAASGGVMCYIATLWSQGSFVG